MWITVCVTVSHPRKEKLRETFYEHFAPTESTDKQHKREERRNVNLLSATYLIAHKCWWMDRPVIWDLLRQAKVSHHSWAHAALPAHQAVLHRGVRGHTHKTHTSPILLPRVCSFPSLRLHCLYSKSDVKYKSCQALPFAFKRVFRWSCWSVSRRIFCKKLTKNSRFLCQLPLWSEHFHRLSGPEVSWFTIWHLVCGNLINHTFVRTTYRNQSLNGKGLKVG